MEAQWVDYDATLLRTLSRARRGRAPEVGEEFNVEFYSNVADKLNETNPQHRFTVYDVGRRTAFHRRHFNNFKVYDPTRYTHAGMDSQVYYDRCRKAFEEKVLKVRVPRSLTCGSTSTVRATAPPLRYAPRPSPERSEDFVRIMSSLRDRHGLHVDVITRFANWVEANPFASEVFFSYRHSAQQLQFIREVCD